MNWHTTNLSDLEILQSSAFANGFLANNYSAVNSVLYERKFHSQIALQDGWLFEKSIEAGKTCFTFPHRIQADEPDLKSAIEILAGDSAATGGQLLFTNVTAGEKDALLAIYPGAKAVAVPELGDYIYRTEKLASLAGKKLGRKRNHIHQFEGQYPSFSFEPMSARNLDDVRSVENAWFSEAESSVSDEAYLSGLRMEKEIIFSALGSLDVFVSVSGMTGLLLYVSGIPVAFCIASMLSGNVVDVHFEKCLAPYDRAGGYAMINNAFSKTVRAELVNREEDLGIEGLRKAKLSYYPDMLLEKFNVELIQNT